jgi:flavin reductase (DIM6/NTAB) family NADH-FMN oxidoreductase RutF
MRRVAITYPYSAFNGVAYTPPQMMFASTGAAGCGDQRQRCQHPRNRVFCVNVVEYAARDDEQRVCKLARGRMNLSRLASTRPPVSTIAPAPLARPPLECRMTQIIKTAAKVILWFLVRCSFT